MVAPPSDRRERPASSMLTPAEVLRRQARAGACQDKVALVEGDERVTYGELNERVNRTARQRRWRVPSPLWSRR